VSSYSDCPTATSEAATLHAVFLNRLYNLVRALSSFADCAIQICYIHCLLVCFFCQNVLNQLRSEGCFDTFLTKLGYRMEVRSVSIPRVLPSTGQIDISVTIANTVSVTLLKNLVSVEWKYIEHLFFVILFCFKQGWAAFANPRSVYFRLFSPGKSITIDGSMSDWEANGIQPIASDASNDQNGAVSGSLTKKFSIFIFILPSVSFWK
jgi:hypothetical protein